MKLVGVYGASGFGVETMPITSLNAKARFGDEVELVFVDDGAGASAKLNGRPVVTWQGFLDRPADEKHMTIAIANSAVRQKLAERCFDHGVHAFHTQADNVVVLDDVAVGEGAVLSPFTMLTSNITIGKQFHANIYSYVAHNCVVGDYVTFAPRVMCNGNVHIGDHAYIGTGAVIKQGTPDNPMTIGAGATIGMGAVVTKPVPAGVTVVGNPARPMG